MKPNIILKFKIRNNPRGIRKKKSVAFQKAKVLFYTFISLSKALEVTKIDAAGKLHLLNSSIDI